MKKRDILIIVVLTALTFNFTPAISQENSFQPKGKPIATIFSNFNITSSDGEYKSAFAVERVYFGYQYEFSEKFSARVLFDIGDPGVGKLNHTAYVKNAYLQYSPGDLTIAFGMIGTTYFRNQEKFFPYRYIIKPYQDMGKLSSSADLGVSLDYKIGKMISFDLMAVNGEGYKSVQKDSVIRIATGVNLTPFEGLFLRGAFDISPGENAQKTTTFFATYGFGPARVGFEYTRQVNQSMQEGENLGGFSVVANADLSKSVTLFGRYDMLSSDILPGETDPWHLGDDGKLLLIGFDYSPVKGVRIAPNYEGWFPADASEFMVSTFRLNFEVKF